MGMTHTPLIYWSKKTPPEADRAAVFASFGQLRKRMDEASPDAIIVIANDHIDNFFYDNMPPFCVGISKKAEGPFSMEHEMGLPKYSCPVKDDLATQVFKTGLSMDMDLASTQEFGVDHAFVMPLLFVAPSMSVPIVPVFTNTLVPPIPQPKRFYHLGKMISAAIEKRPKDERIAVLASFNLSIEVGGPRMRQIDQDFNQSALELMGAGRVDDILSQFTLRRIFNAGNATGEFLNYLGLLGIMGSEKPAYIDLRNPPFWGSCPAIAWDT